MTSVDRSRLPALGPDPVFRFPEIARHTLGNGLQVRTVEHWSSPVISFVLQVEGGSGADPAGRDGLAAVTADLVDEGTGALSALDVADALARIGGEYDVTVAPDVNTFMLTTLTRFAERGAALFSDLIARPSLREVDFARVRQLRLDRLRQLKDLAPAVAERAFLRLMYDGHPYGHLAIGDDVSLRAMSLDEVAAFHTRLFRPSSATLVVVGAMAHESLLDLASDAFAGWRSGHDGAPPSPAATLDPARPRDRRLAVVPREGAAQSELRIGLLAVGRNTPDYHALLVMNAVLGGQFVSRVNLKLREEKGYTYGARTGFDWRRGVAPFSLQASVHTASTADAIRDAVAEIEGIQGARPVSETELAQAKASLTKGYPRNFETAQQVARSVSQLALYGLPDSYFEAFVPHVNAIAAADVTRVARQYLDPAALTTLVVGDNSAIAESLVRIGFGAATVMPAEL